VWGINQKQTTLIRLKASYYHIVNRGKKRGGGGKKEKDLNIKCGRFR
jgi:hypothetical protein